MSKINVDSIDPREPGGSIGISTNINVTGVATATSFSGDGSNLTGVVIDGEDTSMNITNSLFI